jgi:hypothetical protein
MLRLRRKTQNKDNRGTKSQCVVNKYNPATLFALWVAASQAGRFLERATRDFIQFAPTRVNIARINILLPPKRPYQRRYYINLVFSDYGIEHIINNGRTPISSNHRGRPHLSSLILRDYRYHTLSLSLTLSESQPGR